jgi:hypothetical protein
MDLKSMSFNFYVFPLLILALWQAGSCRSDHPKTMTKEQHRVSSGSWGGQNIGLNVTDTGAAIQFPCAHGTIDQLLVLNDQGRFSAKGTFVAERPGPTREDNPPEGQPALYEGTVTNETMTLTVTLSKTKEQVGSFNLEHGKTGRVRKCK